MFVKWFALIFTHLWETSLFWLRVGEIVLLLISLSKASLTTEGKIDDIVTDERAPAQRAFYIFGIDILLSTSLISAS